MKKDDKRNVITMILDVLEFCFKGVNERLPPQDKRSGGYFCLGLSDPSEQPLLIIKVGEQPADKSARSFAFCQEKMRRLQNNPADLSSWQSRDPEKDQYGGAVRCGDFILSFSGLPEHVDEYMMLVILNMDEWGGYNLSQLPNQTQLIEIASISGNPLIEWKG